MECIAVVPHLRWARNFRLCPLPLPIPVPFLSQHPHPRLEFGKVRQIVLDKKWFNAFRCYVIHRPYPSHVCRELGLVPVPDGTGVSQIDILLSVLTIKPNLVQCLTKMGGARHACVSVGNIQTA